METQVEAVQDWWLHEAGFCGCGRPADVMKLVLKALEAHGEPGPEFDGGPEANWDDPNAWLLAYCLDRWELTEHGGGVGGAWLTEKGIKLRDALRAVDIETALEPIDVEEAEEAECFVARCNRHDPSRNCQASLPDCEREMIRLPSLEGKATFQRGERP